MFAIVKVLPEPVTPKSVWYLWPDFNEDNKPSIARGWSPAGLKLDFKMKRFIRLIGPIGHIGNFYNNTILQQKKGGASRVRAAKPPGALGAKVEE